MNKFLLIFFICNMITVNTFLPNKALNNDDQNNETPHLAIINNQTGEESVYSLEQKVNELSIKVDQLTQIIHQSNLSEEKKQLTIKCLSDFIFSLKGALQIGASVVIVIAGGYILLKLQQLIKPVYEAGKSVFLNLHKFCRDTKTNIINPTISYVKDDIFDPIVWLLSIPYKTVPQPIKERYVSHNKNNPFI